MILRLLTMIFIGALIGWITNWLAIKMLFHPYQEKRFLFFKIQGLIPKRRAEIGTGISKVMEEELISLQELLEKIDIDLVFGKLEMMIDQHLNENLETQIKEAFPFAAMFLGKESMEKIKRLIKNGIMSKKEDLLSSFSTSLEETIDMKAMIEDKISSFSLEKLEEIIFRLAKRELKHIEWIGAVLGGILGGVQFLLFHFI